MAAESETHDELPWDIFKGKIEMTDDFDAPLDEFNDYLLEDLFLLNPEP